MKNSRVWCVLIPVVIYLVVWSNIGRHTDSGQSGKDLSSVQGPTREIRAPAEESLDAREAITTQGSQPPATGEKTPGFDGVLVSGHQPKYRTFLTIGIPTISRPKGIAYLEATLNSLIDNSTPNQRRGLLIVIFLADFNQTAKAALNKKLLTKFQSHFDSGLIQTIQAPRSYYPSFDNLKRTYNQPDEQVQWRSKQNFDYAFIMEYSQNQSVFYLQLEDDVTTVPNYIKLIRDYIGQVPQWTCLEFSDLGFIAKLYQTTDLGKLAQFLKLFFNEQPNDVLYLHFNEIMTQFRRYVRKPTIFQHKGMVSSLGLKMEMLRDVYFQGDEKERKAKSRSNQKRLEVPLAPVQVRQLGRVQGPEMIVWAERRRDEKKLNKQINIQRVGLQ